MKEPLNPASTQNNKKRSHWVEKLFRNAPVEVQEKAKASYWKAADVLWHALCFSVVYALIGAWEFGIFEIISRLLNDALNQSKWLANLWNNVQIGVALVTIIAWVIHVLLSALTQVALDFDYTFEKKKK